MSDSVPNQDALGNMSREEMMSALFAHLVMQNTNMALMFLGKVPHPQSGESVQDFETARMFIDQLEMLECKTKGNLTRDEDKLLQQSLTNLRMTFVHAVENPIEVAPAKQAEKSETSPAQGTSAPAPSASVEAGESESRKRFSKKF